MSEEETTEQAAGDAAASEVDAEESSESESEADVLGPRSTSLVAKVTLADETLAEDLEEHLVELESERKEAVERAEELEGKLQRTRADFKNYKKRAKQRQEEMEARAAEGVVERMLSVRDNLSRALSEESGDADSLREGVELTLEEFDRVLAEEGVEEIAPEPGSETDPNRHEVMMRVEGDEPEGTIAEVYRPGYEMGGKVVRAAQVTVSEGSDDGDDGAE